MFVVESKVGFLEPLCWTKSEPAVYQILQNKFTPGVVFTAYQQLVDTYTVLLEAAGSCTGSQATHTMLVLFVCVVLVSMWWCLVIP